MGSSLNLIAVLVFVCTVNSTAIWTTKASVPYFQDRGGAAALGASTIVYVRSSKTHAYDLVADTWTTWNPQPTPRFLCQAVSLTNRVLNVAGWIPGYSDNAEVVDAQGDWSVLAPMPINRDAAGACSDGATNVWVMGGDTGPVTNALHHFDVDADMWTTLMPFPSSVDFFSMAYDSGRVLTFGGKPSMIGETYCYTVAADAWALKQQMPLSGNSPYEAAVARDGLVYITGGDLSTNSFQVYTIEADTWTSYDPLPKVHRMAGTAISPSGVIIVVGSSPTLTYVHAYALDPLASITGDPTFSTFGGTEIHLNLHPGVFNVFSSPYLVVNALVDTVDALPVEEDLVMVVIGIVARFGTTLVQISCTVVDSSLECQGSAPTNNVNEEFVKTFNNHNIYTGVPNTALFRLPCADIKVMGRIAHTSHLFSRVSENMGAAYLDFQVQAVRSPGLCAIAFANSSGLLGDLDTLPTSVILGRLASFFYESETDGGIFSLDARSASVFQ